MKVTITLGPEAMEFVTGIPEEELPEILSDVVERSLRQQVRPLSPANSTPGDNTTEDLLDKLRALLNQSNINQTSNAQDKGEPTTNNAIKEAIVEVATSIKLDTKGIDLEGFEDLLK